jgi:hypothetical protein
MTAGRTLVTRPKPSTASATTAAAPATAAPAAAAPTATAMIGPSSTRVAALACKPDSACGHACGGAERPSSTPSDPRTVALIHAQPKAANLALILLRRGFSARAASPSQHDHPSDQNNDQHPHCDCHPRSHSSRLRRTTTAT